MATQSLMLALDRARTILEQGGDVPDTERCSLLGMIVQGYHQHRSQAVNLYVEAGMHPPDRAATGVVTPAPWTPHAKGLPKRIVAALSDHTRWTSATLSAALGVSRSHLHVAISRLRSEGCPIETHRGKSIRLEQT